MVVGEGIAGLVKCFACCITGCSGIGKEERIRLKEKKRAYGSFIEKWHYNRSVKGSVGPKTIPELKQYLAELNESIYKDEVNNYYNSNMYESVICTKNYIDLAIYICNNYQNLTFHLSGSDHHPKITFGLNKKITIKFNLLCTSGENISVKDDFGMKSDTVPTDPIEYVQQLAKRYSV